MAQIYNRRVLRGGLFLVSDIEHKRPLSWRGGQRILRQVFEGAADMDRFWLELGERLKKELVTMIETQPTVKRIYQDGQGAWPLFG